MSNPSPEKSDLDRVLAAAFKDLDNHHAEDKEHAAATDQVVKLHELKMKELSLEMERDATAHTQAIESRTTEIEATRHRFGISNDTLAIVLGNLLGIAMIVEHERASIVTSKALGFIKTIVR
jgi:hypothetical protein